MERPVSAFMCSSRLFAALGVAAVQYRLCEVFDGQGAEVFRVRDSRQVAQLLAEENARSVRYLYGEPVAVPVELPMESLRPPMVLLKAISCLEYQSCEHPGWPDSIARHLLRALAWRVIMSLPEWDGVDGWGDFDEAARVGDVGQKARPFVPGESLEVCALEVGVEGATGFWGGGGEAEVTPDGCVVLSLSGESERVLLIAPRAMVAPGVAP